MSRRFTALKPQLNRIRAWAHEGSTDAWIAHQLETTAEAVRAFRQEHGIERGGPAPLAPITPDSVVEAMLAEEEAAAAAAELGAAEVAAAAAELEPEASAPEPEAPVEDEPAPRRKTRQRAAKPAEQAPEPVAAESAPAEDAPARSTSSRRRGARGGAGRGAAATAAAATTEVVDEQPAAEAEEVETAGDDEPARSGTARKRGGRRRGRGRGAGRGLEARLLAGSVLLLDPAVTADALFQEHWGEAGPLRVEISADTIVLRRSAADEPSPT
jgi:hypothetical protein